MNHYATIVISYRRPDLLASVLGRIAGQSSAPALVVVVDNSGDLDESVLQAAGPDLEVSLVRRPDNPGYGAAVNAVRDVVLAAGVSSLLVLTHDAAFDESFAARASQLLSATGAGAVAPILYWSDQPDRIFSAGGRLSRTGRAWNSVHPRASVPYDVDWVDGAIVMYAVSALEAVGWIDPDYFLYFEDVDTAWRMRGAGWQTLVDPHSSAYQQPGNHPMYLGIRNMTRFALKARVPAALSAVGVARRVLEESVHRVLHGRPPELREAIRGWRDGRHGLTGHPAARNR